MTALPSAIGQQAASQLTATLKPAGYFFVPLQRAVV